MLQFYYMPTPKKSPGKELATEVRKLTMVIEKQNRLRWRFLYGLFFGVGSAIGATVIAGLIIYFASQVLDVVGMSSIIDPASLEL